MPQLKNENHEFSIVRTRKKLACAAREKVVRGRDNESLSEAKVLASGSHGEVDLLA